VTSTYAYNGDGLRMSDTPAGGSAQQFTWDTSGSVPNLLEDGTNYYLYGPNIGSAPLEQISISGSTPTYLVSDTTGVREQLSSGGSVTGSMSYDTYGNACGACSISTPFGFEGGYTDGTGLLYLVNRYYDPATGQFLSVDPLVDETGTPYAFTDGDPVNGSDPNGLGCTGIGGFLASLSPISHCNYYFQQAENDPVAACDNDPLLFGTKGGVCGRIPGSVQDPDSRSCTTLGFGSALKPGASEQGARQALENDGVKIPDDYVAEQIGKGWVFRAPGTTGNRGTIRAMDSNADPTRYPDGYMRVYNNQGGGQPIDLAGRPGPNEDTHFPFSPEIGAP
jgi:RHS repeat-associated protein